MISTAPTQATVWQGSDCLLLARVRNIDGTYLQQAALSGIALTVRDKSDGNAVVVGPLALTISSVVFDTLQTNPVIWTNDATGYNFLTRVAGAAAFPDAHDYRVDVIFTMTDSTTFPLQFDLATQAVP